VFLAGFRADALELTKGFDLFAMSSLFEGTCTALLDAMAAAKATVATAIGGIREVMIDGQSGYLVPPRDHQAMAARLVALLEDEPLRRRMGESARARVAELFTVDGMVAEIAAVYEQLVASRSARPVRY
jgi:glycosyltransferase involved in cell wall biosynthesis